MTGSRMRLQPRSDIVVLRVREVEIVWRVIKLAQLVGGGGQ